MEAAPDDESAGYIDTTEEPTGNVIDEQEVVHEEVVQEEEVIHDEEMIQVQHEEVLEEIVEEDGMVYDTDGRVIEYRDMMVYEEEEAEVIEEYVEVEDLGNGQFAYVMTDEHGRRRLLKEDEVEAMKKMPQLVEEVIVDPKEMEAGPSSSGDFQNHKRGRFPPKGSEKLMRPQVRGGMVKSHMMYDVQDGYYGGASKGINEMAKVEVEKYVPSVTINRRPLSDNPVFKQKAQRSRKNPPWQDEPQAGSSSGGPSTSVIHRSPSPINKDPLFSMQEDDTNIRFKCPECGEGFSNMERHCQHMVKKHDCQTFVREVDFFADREFDNFLVKVEKATLGKETDEVLRKKTRAGVSQIFVCNYMNKGSQKDAELIEVGVTELQERPMEVCTAFVQKVHSYECIHVKYCDQHIHYDGNIGFRVPLAVKRRLFEMSFKRLPVPCMQVMLGIEAEELLPHPTRFEEKLKNLSHVEVVELLGIINASLRKYQDVEPKGRRVPIKFDTIKTSEGAPTLVVKRLEPPKKEPDFMQDDSSRPCTSAQAMGFHDDGRDVPMMAREEEVEEAIVGDYDGIMDDNFLYDPQNDRDPLIEELTEVELGVLEAYERDITVKLSDEQKKERIRQKAKFSLSKVVSTYQSLDAATHGLSAAELHSDTINQLREMASYVVELCCQLDAEVKSQFNPNLKVEEIKRDMIAGIALQERTYQPERRQRRVGGGPSSHHTPPKSHYRGPARTHEEYSQRVLMNQVRDLQESPPIQRQLMNISDTFDDLNQQQRLQHLREQTLRNNGGSLEPESEEKAGSSMAPISDEMKAVPWSKPNRKRQQGENTPGKKRGRPNKKVDAVDTQNGESPANLGSGADHPEGGQPTSGSIESTIDEVIAQNITFKSTETIQVDVQATAVELKEAKEEPSPSLNPITPTTKTRTGRVVKPKKWGDD